MEGQNYPPTARETQRQKEAWALASEGRFSDLIPPIRRLSHRQGYREYRSLPGGALCVYSPVMKFHKLLRQRQTDSSPFGCVSLIGTVEAVKYVGKVFRGDAGAGVGDRDFQEFYGVPVLPGDMIRGVTRDRTLTLRYLQ